MARSMRAQWPSWASVSGKHLIFLLLCSPAIAEFVREDASTVDVRLSTARFAPSHRRLLVEAPDVEDSKPKPNDSPASTPSPQPAGGAVVEDTSVNEGTSVKVFEAHGYVHMYT